MLRYDKKNPIEITTPVAITFDHCDIRFFDKNFILGGAKLSVRDYPGCYSSDYSHPVHANNCYLPDITPKKSSQASTGIVRRTLVSWKENDVAGFVVFLRLLFPNL